jgi:hypothetical protein
MNLAALWHACRPPFAYAGGRCHVRLVLLAARGDLSRVHVVFGDRYESGPEPNHAALDRLGDDGRHEYWGVTVPVPTRRLRYKLWPRAWTAIRLG